MTTAFTPGHHQSDLCATQHGVLATHQALKRFTPAFIRAQLAAQRWQRPHRGVIVLHNGPLTERQRIWVALTAAQPGSVLGGVTALTVDGLRTLTTDVIDV